MVEYIFKFDAVDALCEFPGKSPTGKTAQEIVSDLPAADVRPVVHGKWIPAPWFVIYGCDECDQCHLKMQYGRNYNFCPKCGADMRGD